MQKQICLRIQPYRQPPYDYHILHLKSIHILSAHGKTLTNYPNQYSRQHWSPRSTPKVMFNVILSTGIVPRLNTHIRSVSVLTPDSVTVEGSILYSFCDSRNGKYPSVGTTPGSR